VNGAVAVFPKGSSAVVALGVTSKLGTKSQRDFDGYNDMRRSRDRQKRRNNVEDGAAVSSPARL